MIRHGGWLAAAALALLLLWAPLPFASVTPAGLGGARDRRLPRPRPGRGHRRGPLRRPARRPAARRRRRRRRPGAGAVAPLAGARRRPGSRPSMRAPGRRGPCAARGPTTASADLPSAPSTALSPVPSTRCRSPPRPRAGAALAWAAAAAALAAAAVAGRDRRHRRLLAAALGAAALFQVFYGARAWFARSDAIWGVRGAGHRRAPARHLRQPGPPGAAPRHGAARRLRLGLVGGAAGARRGAGRPPGAAAWRRRCCSG